MVSIKKDNLQQKDMTPLIGSIVILGIVTLIMMIGFLTSSVYTGFFTYLPLLIPLSAGVLAINSEKEETFTSYQVYSVVVGVIFVALWIVLGIYFIQGGPAWTDSWIDPMDIMIRELIGSIAAGFVGASQT